MGSDSKQQVRILRFVPILILVSGLLQPIQAQCSNGSVTFKLYLPVEYNSMARAMRWEADVKADLIVTGGGNAGSGLTLANLAVFEKNGEEFINQAQILIFQTSVQEAVTSWRLINETGAQLSLPLVVEFRLVGTSAGETPEDQRNLVMLTSEELRIRVIAKTRGGNRQSR